MDEEKVIPQEQGTPGLVPVEKPKRTPVRSIEELHNVDPKKMTEAEAVNYIKVLREQNCKLTAQCDGYKANCDSAYEKIRTLDKMFTDYKLRAQSRVNFIKQAVATCNTSIMLAGNLED